MPGATFKGPELLVDAAIAKLQANMPARIQSINAERSDGITCVAVDNARYFSSMKRQIPPPGPAVLVMDGAMTLDPRGEGPHSLLTNVKLGIYVLEEDSDEEKLARKLWRQTRAVIESLWDAAPQEQLAMPTGTGTAAYKIVPMQTVPGPAFEPEGRGPALRQYYCVTFMLTRLEQ